ncbi:multiple resistance and pH regulation protein F [Nitrosococcus halophilus Nc 4]|uniref:Multiple resistance and pH regulation protein F n=1 Tax=Nitrosococcus halophilus (strain Nc4) TaxID=472759 RepID=D5C349_NITHN|nr:monovalent cation/H+ antiporter complex subunit F [Nitrosococcus halophilus]ADE14941.1 multiple resistance and pH regulation protein F [Nitrosococcus halophilus Nc 4]
MALFDLELVLSEILIVTIMVGLIRIVRGPTAADRMLTAQLFGTTSVAILLLLGEATDTPALQDVALVFALLAAIAGIAFVQRIWGIEPETHD